MRAFIDISATAITGGKEWYLFSTGGSASEGTGKLIFKDQTDAVMTMALTSSGNVGIGTTGPGYKLELSATAQSDLSWVTTTNSRRWNIAVVDSDGRFTFYRPGVAEYLTLSNAGNVGIGTTGPGNYKLYINDSGQNTLALNSPTIPVQRFEVAGTDLWGFLVNYGSANGFVIYNYNNSSVAMQFTSTGNVGIGTTAPSLADASSVTLQLKNKYILQPVIGTQAYLGYNIYYPGGSYWKYAASDFASGIRFNAYGNGISFHVAPSGIAGANDTTWDSSDIRMVINSSGNVGIGTTGPASTLHVNGTIVGGTGTPTVGDIASRSMILTARPGGTYSSLGFETGSTYRGDFDFLGSTGDMRWWLWNGSTWTNTVSILGSGNVGIGTTCPVTKLDLGGSGNIGLGVYSGVKTQYIGLYGSGGSFADNSGTGNIYFQTLSDGASNAVGFVTHHSGVSDTTRMYIDRDGNVGIGTTGPQNKLHVYGTWAGFYGQLTLQDPSTGIVGMSLFQGNTYKGWLVYGNTANKLELQNYNGGSGGDILLNPNYGGNVGIGTTGPWANLHVAQNDGAADSVRAPIIVSRWWANSTDTRAGAMYSYYNSTTANDQLVFGVTGGGGLLTSPALYSNAKMVIQGNGNVGIGTTGPNVKLDVAGNVFVRGSGTYYNNAGAGELQVGYGLALPNTAGSVTRLVLQPYGHTGGPWKFDARDTSGNAYLDIYYGGSGVGSGITMHHAGNVGIGTTGPSTRFETQGVLRVIGEAASNGGWGTGPWGVELGRDANYGYVGSYDRSSSTYKPLYLFASKILLNGGGEGNVGIGTTGPRSVLEVAGAGTLRITNTAANPNWYGWVLSQDSSAHLDFSYPGVTQHALYLKYDTGNVGIGTTGPSAKLNLYDASVTDTLKIEGRASGNNAVGEVWLVGDLGVNAKEFRIQAVGGSHPTMGNKMTIYDQTAGAYRMIIDTNGNVGIGTTGPGAKLDIRDDNNWSSGWRNTLRLQSDYYPNVRLYALTANKTSGIGNDNDGGLWFFINGTEDTYGSYGMVILPGGNVGIGTTSPLSGLGWPSPGLEISGGRGTLGLTTTSTGGLATLRFKGPTSGSEMHWNFTDAATPDLTLYSYAGGGYMFTLKGTGNVGIGTTGPSFKLTVSGVSNGIGVVPSDSPFGTKLIIIGGGPTGLGATSNVMTNFNGVWNTNKSSLVTDFTGYAFNVSGSEKVRIDTSGNVGIGTTGPQSKLDFGTSVANQKLIIGTYTTGNLWSGIGMSTTTAGLRIAGDNFGGNNILDVGYYSFDASHNWTSYVFVNGTGNVGIGTTTPGQGTSPDPNRKLLVAGGITVTQGNMVSYSDAYYVHGYQAIDNNDTLLKSFAYYGQKFFTSGGEMIRLTQGGNVGIGTTGPTTKLDFGAANTGNIGLGQYNGAVATRYVGLYGSGGSYADGSGATAIYFKTEADGASGSIGFLTHSSGVSNTTRMFIDKAGNVGIGTTGPSDKLSVNAVGSANEVLSLHASPTNVTLSPSIGFYGTADTTWPAAKIGVVYNSSISTDVTGLAFYTRNGWADINERMRIQYNGNVGIGTTGPQAPLEIYKNGAAADTNGGGLIVSRYDGGGSNYRGGAIYSRYFTGPNTDALVFGVTTTNGKNPYSDLDQVRMVIQATGNVGIGTTGPGEKLEVYGGNLMLDYTTGSTGLMLQGTGLGHNLTLWNDNSNIIHLVNQNTTLKLGEGGADRVTITSGNVGIGTTGPNSKLEIVGPDTGEIRLTRSAATNQYMDIYAGGADTQFISTNLATADYPQFQFIAKNNSTSVIRMFINQSGNVGIGTTGPSSPLEIVKAQARTSLTGSAKGLLHLNAGPNAAGEVTAITFDSYQNLGPSTIIGQRKDNNGGELFFGTSNSWGTVTNTAMFIDYNGNVGIGTTGLR